MSIDKKYEAALAASDGWIEWGGGECPVERGTLVDIKDRDGYVSFGVEALNDIDAEDIFWRRGVVTDKDTEIIAYRPHRDINSRANDDRLEQDLNECIGQGVDVQEWNGEGLPPVGVECEYSLNSGGTWFKCKIDYILGTQGLVMLADVFEGGQWVSFHEYDGKLKFRPLRTEAEKLRDEAGLALYHAINWNAEGEMVSPSRMEDYKKAYDAISAGKIPGVKLEGK